jgi:hypothetical protein
MFTFWIRHLNPHNDRNKLVICFVNTSPRMLSQSLAQKLRKSLPNICKKWPKQSQSQEKSKYLHQINFKALKYLQQTMI